MRMFASSGTSLPVPWDKKMVMECLPNIAWIFYLSVGQRNAIFPSLSVNKDVISSVQFSCSDMSDSLQAHESQHARPPYPSPTPRVYLNTCPLSWWCHPAISSSGIPFPPAPNPSQHQGIFQWVNSLHDVAKVLEIQLQHQSFQWTPRTDLL